MISSVAVLKESNIYTSPADTISFAAVEEFASDLNATHDTLLMSVEKTDTVFKKFILKSIASVRLQLQDAEWFKAASTDIENYLASESDMTHDGLMELGDKRLVKCLELFAKDFKEVGLQFERLLEFKAQKNPSLLAQDRTDSKTSAELLRGFGFQVAEPEAPEQNSGERPEGPNVLPTTNHLDLGDFIFDGADVGEDADDDHTNHAKLQSSQDANANSASGPGLTNRGAPPVPGHGNVPRGNNNPVPHPPANPQPNAPPPVPPMNPKPPVINPQPQPGNINNPVPAPPGNHNPVLSPPVSAQLSVSPPGPAMSPSLPLLLSPPVQPCSQV
ncbi:unnamed protein product [Amoebophrya sp. A25]|nr:unnamed protein product [Amoebophrya sp. A25]|eukprot:GSA25T00008145001.1